MFPLLAIGGGFTNAIGKLMSGASSGVIDKLQAQVYDTNAETSKTNAYILNEQADTADLGIGFAWAKQRTTEARIEDAGRQTLAAQRSFFAGNNLSASYGSPLLAQALTAGRVQTDVNLSRSSAAIEAANAQTTAANLRGQAAGAESNSLSNLISAAGARMKGDADMTAGFLGAATALLGGFAGAAKGGFSSFGFNPVAGIAGV